MSYLWALLARLDGVQNWKTTILGIVGGVGNYIYDWLNGTVDTKTMMLSCFIFLISYLMKDASKTGTIKNPR